MKKSRMEVFNKISEMREYSRQKRKEGKSIGFVPTLGSLHAGHESLILKSIADCDCTIVSVFLNPIQFDNESDLDRYPVSIEDDLDVCRSLGVDAVFAPDAGEMYGEGSLVMFSVAKLADTLCGMSRPGHFRGVLTVVAKLFNIVEPDFAFFGEKDIQQLVIIRQLIHDLDYAVTLVPVPLVRDEDGLALSSRNKHLSRKERDTALLISRTLTRVMERVRSLEKDSDIEPIKAVDILAEFAEDLVSDPNLELDYFSAVDSYSLNDVAEVRRGTIFAIAAWVGKTRLIDNWIYR